MTMRNLAVALAGAVSLAALATASPAQDGRTRNESFGKPGTDCPAGSAGAECRSKQGLGADDRSDRGSSGASGTGTGTTGSGSTGTGTGGGTGGAGGTGSGGAGGSGSGGAGGGGGGSGGR